MMDIIELKGMTLTEMETVLPGCGLKPFQARQIFRWIYQEGIGDFEQMTDIAKPIRAKLNEIASISSIKIIQQLKSRDGSIKFLFGVKNNLKIESVLIPEQKRTTLCVSCQVGCPVGCKFCATGLLGYKHNLSAGEIVDQFLIAQKHSKNRISNIVFMGMGEPMLNLDTVIKACSILADDYGPSLSRKKITISTVGILNGMRRFIPIADKLGLAISLHSADEEIRSKIIPIASKNSLDEIIAEARRYTQIAKRRVSIEYLLLGGLNDSIADAKKLVKLIHGLPCKINLIRYNPIDKLPFRKPVDEAVQAFKEYLYPRTYAVTIRESRGIDINGACGQLAGRTTG